MTAVASVLLLSMPFALLATAQAKVTVCPFGGKRPPLDEILRRPPNERPPLCGADLTKANLTGADLAGADLTVANLTKANLTKANLTGARLIRANLTGANLTEANLTGAELWWANLTGANLIAADLTKAELNAANLTGADLIRANLVEANLTGAHLARANLTGATLGATLGVTRFGANLTGADLAGANLTGADLAGANFTGAHLTRANLHSAIFEPDPGSLSSVHSIEFAQNLSRLTFRNSEASLVVLRKRFADLGLRRQEREVTFAKLRAQQVNAWRADSIWSKIEAGFSYLAFDLTCGYGLHYGRSLKVLGASIPFMALIYALALRSRGNGALWRVWIPDRVRKYEGQSEPERLSWEMKQRPEIHGAVFSFGSAAPSGSACSSA
jgi:uncharacterized protein YjbI with pentapeptide repeats